MGSSKIGVIGGGSWATAIVKILSDNQPKVNWWVRETEIVEGLKKFGHNPLYLSSVVFKMNKLFVSLSIKEIVRNSDIVLLCAPSAFIHQTLKDLTPEDFKNKIVISAIKGIVPEYNMIVGDYVQQILQVPASNFVVVSGPSHAEEVADEKLTYLTVASQDTNTAEKISNMFSNHYIKTSISDDIFGTEYGAVLKNIYAIAVGITKGVGYGDNFRAVVIANAMQEMKRFIDAVHPIDRDLTASVYLGDLLVTAYSQFSRNRLFGTMLGSGYTVKSAQMEMNMIAEGYYASKCIYEINKNYQVDMPIAEAVYNIIYQHVSPAVEIELLSEKLS